jgi:hypothetical protein
MAKNSADDNHEKKKADKEKAAEAKSHDDSKDFAEQLEAVRLSIAEARVIAEETAGDDETMERALARMVQTHLFTIMQKMLTTERKGKNWPDIHAIARTICAVSKQGIEMERWRVEAGSRVNAGVDAAAARVEEARESGLTPDAAEKIRSALLDIKL